MAKKTSKTAHVMNLLTKSDGTDEIASTASKNDINESNPLQSEADISNQISNALEDLLQEETSDISNESVQEETAPVAKEEPINEPTPQVADEVDDLKKVTSSLPATVENFHNTYDSETLFINIMEEIVIDEREHYMEKFDICRCDICTKDVTAFALNLLPPKYVVTHKGEVFAKLATFTQQYSADIITAITKACIKVKESPRHDK